MTLVFDYLDNFEEHWWDKFVNSFFYWDLPDGFLMIRMRLWVLERRSERYSAFSSHHIKGTDQHITLDVDLDDLGEVMSVMFLYDKVTLSFPLCILYLMGRKSVTMSVYNYVRSISHLCNGELHSLRVVCLHKLFGILHGRLVSFLVFIYFFNDLFMSAWLMDMYFILWVIIQHYFVYFLDEIAPALATGSNFSWCLCPFDILPHIIVGFVVCLFLSSFLLSGTTKCSCIFPARVLESAISPRIPGLLLGAWYEKWRSRCWVHSHCYWDTIAFRFSQLISVYK